MKKYNFFSLYLCDFQVFLVFLNVNHRYYDIPNVIKENTCWTNSLRDINILNLE